MTQKYLILPWGNNIFLDLSLLTMFCVFLGQWVSYLVLTDSLSQPRVIGEGSLNRGISQIRLLVAISEVGKAVVLIVNWFGVRASPPWVASFPRQVVLAYVRAN